MVEKKAKKVSKKGVETCDIICWEKPMKKKR